MAREVYTDEEFISFSRKFVFVRVLADKDPAGAQLEKRYQVNGYPHLLILDSEGREVDRIRGAAPSAKALIEELEMIFEFASDNTRISL